MPGRPIQIATPIAPETPDDKETGAFSFNPDLPNLIGSGDSNDLDRLSKTPVAVISVAGAFRKGKSFLLNFFIRYLNSLRSGDSTDWIRSKQILDDGFPWRSGTERDTAGILIWSEPFYVRRSDNKEVAVFIMDTQGTFDHQSTQQDCTTIFAFSTLLSSVQIFNLSQNIQETDLQHLRLFVEFASMAKQSNEKVLQHLWFLVRDWQNPDEYDYGIHGGNAYLDGVLACSSEKPRENQELRQGIKKQFQKASCCLLPYPGEAVTSKAFNGEIEKLNSNFVNNLRIFVETILSPENLVVKKLNGRELTGLEYFDLIGVYFDAFKHGNLPMPKSIFMATIEMANIIISDDAKKYFKDTMNSLSDPTNAISDTDLDKLLNKTLEEALNQFDSKCMERDSRDTKVTRRKLDEQLRSEFERERMNNKLKSDKISSEEKNRLMAENVQRMQREKSDSDRRNETLERKYAEAKREIQESRASNKEKEARQQELDMRLSVEKKAEERYQRRLIEVETELLRVQKERTVVGRFFDKIGNAMCSIS